jgi:anti-sigma factor RsiW
MTGVQSEELSGLLDGELDEERAMLVRAQIEADTELGAEYAALLRLHVRLHSAADAVAFLPEVAGPTLIAKEAGEWHWAAGGAAVLGLMLVRLVPKFIDLAGFGLSLQLVVAAVVIAAIVKMANESDRLERVSPRGAIVR